MDVTEGEHRVRIVIDSSNSVREASEDDNVFETAFEWLSDTPPGPNPTSYENEDIAGLLSGLREFADSGEVAVSDDGIDHSERIIGIVDAGYYLMTGTSLRNERAEILLLSRANYRAWIDEEFENQFATAGAREMPGVYFNREKLKEFAVGFTSRRLGRVVVVINGERPIPNVIDTLAHVVGHMRQDLVNPALQNAATINPLISGLLEAQAQQFQHAFWLTVEEFTGGTFLTFPDAPMFREFIAQHAENWIRGAGRDEHFLGYLLLWFAVTTAPQLEAASNELSVAGALGAQAAVDTYDYLVGLSPRDAQTFIRRTYGSASSAGLTALFNIMVSVGTDRLVPDLHPDDEGLANLKSLGLLSP